MAKVRLYYLLPNRRYRLGTGTPDGRTLLNRRKGQLHVLDTETVWIRKKKPLRVQSWDELLAIPEPFPAPGETDQAALYTWDHPLPQPVNGAYTESTVAPILEDLYVDHLQKNALAKAIENDHPKGTVMVMAAAAISVLLAAVLGVGALSRFV